MITLASCPSCSTHVRGDEATCPFCDVVLESPVTGAPKVAKLAAVAATVISVLSIAACGYGLPPRAPDAGVDAHAVDAHAVDAHAVDAPHVDAH